MGLDGTARSTWKRSAQLNTSSYGLVCLISLEGRRKLEGANGQMYFQTGWLQLKGRLLPADEIFPLKR